MDHILFSNPDILLMVLAPLLWFLAHKPFSGLFGVVYVYRLLAVVSFVFGFLIWLGVIQ